MGRRAANPPGRDNAMSSGVAPETVDAFADSFVLGCLFGSSLLGGWFFRSLLLRSRLLLGSSGLGLGRLLGGGGLASLLRRRGCLLLGRRRLLCRRGLLSNKKYVRR